MSPRRAAWLAGATLASTLVLLLVQTYYVIAGDLPLYSVQYGLNSFPVITVGTALGAMVGALVASRHPRNAVGWLFCGGALGTAAGLATEAFARAVQLQGLPSPGWLVDPAIAVNYVFGGMWAVLLVGAVFLVFPDGRLPSPRWRVVAWAMPLTAAVALGVFGFLAATTTLSVQDDDNDFARWVVVVLAALTFVVSTLTLLSTIALIRRLRRATGVRRQQMRWLATAATGLLIGLAIAFAAPDPKTHSSVWLYFLPIYVAYCCVPIAAGVAVLRYRLYDIDVVISRAVVLSLLLAFVTGGYIAAVVVLGRLLGERTGAGFWPSLLATALVALAFQPLRRRVGRVADRLTYGARAQPYEALADLGRRLGESPAPGTFLPAVAEAAANAVGARRATVLLSVPGGSERVATWPDGEEPSPTATSVPVTDHGEQLGSISVALPPGRSLRPHEERLLTDLADQTALAFRNARLTAELALRVAEVDDSAAALSRSRHRIIDARDSERARLESAIRREVLPSLEPLPEAIAQLHDRAVTGAGADCTADDVQPLIEATTSALDELREITRGIFPAQLVRGGLVPAIATHLGKAGGSDELVVAESAQGRRFDARIEAAAYFCYVEAARGLGSPRRVDLTVRDGRLLLQVEGVERGVDGVESMRDRVETLGGTVERVSTGARGQVRAAVPVGAGTPVDPARERVAQSSAAE